MESLPLLKEHQIHVLIFSYVFFSGAVLAAWLFFLHSIRKTLCLVPKNKRIFPIWFLGVTALFALSYALSWSVSIPGVSLLAGFIGLIFSWLMFPFAVPKSLYFLADHDESLRRKIRNLGYMGLANQLGILILFAIKVFLFFIPQGEEELLILTTPHSGSLLSFFLAVILALIAATVVVSWVFYWARVVSIRSDLRQ